MNKDVITHYDMLIQENNDPVHDTEPMKKYMDQWDGKIFLEELKIQSNKSVLEIGIGTGRLALKVVPLCRTFTGIDISPKTIKRARINLAGNDNVILVCADFMEHHFDCKFDVIYSSLVFMHFEDKEKAILKIAHLLDKKGRFVLSIDKNKDEFLDMGTRKIRIFPDDPKDLCRCVNKAGLMVEKQLETEFAYILVVVNEKDNHLIV